MANGHARPSQIHKTLGTVPRSLVRWRKQLDAQGAGSFYQLRAVRGAASDPSTKSQRSRPEQLRHHPPGELGKTVGLDRVPEVRTLREKNRPMEGQNSRR